jgi:hypothetical protein
MSTDARKIANATESLRQELADFNKKAGTPIDFIGSGADKEGDFISIELCRPLTAAQKKQLPEKYKGLRVKVKTVANLPPLPQARASSGKGPVGIREAEAGAKALTDRFNMMTGDFPIRTIGCGKDAKGHYIAIRLDEKMTDQQAAQIPKEVQVPQRNSESTVGVRVKTRVIGELSR